MAAQKKLVPFRIEIAMKNDTNIFVSSADVAMQYYPPKSDQKNIGLIVNLAKKYGKPIIDKSDKNCIVMYMILSEYSQIAQLNDVCIKVFEAISQTLFEYKKNVIIHCNEGRTRSPTVTYLYMILVLGWSATVANAYLPASKFMSCINTVKAKQEYLPQLKQKYAFKDGKDNNDNKQCENDNANENDKDKDEHKDISKQ